MKKIVAIEMCGIIGNGSTTRETSETVRDGMTLQNMESSRKHL
jgi:hypothetical protein